MKLTDKEGLEIASVVKDVLEGKAVKKEKKNVKEVEEPRPEKEKEFKRKHVIKKSGENPDGTVTKEASDKQAKYKAFFDKALKKFGVKSPAELEGEKKKEFFDYVDKNYEAENEPKESVKEATLKVSGWTGNLKNPPQGLEIVKSRESSFGGYDVIFRGDEETLIKYAKRSLDGEGDTLSQIQTSIENVNEGLVDKVKDQLANLKKKKDSGNSEMDDATIMKLAQLLQKKGQLAKKAEDHDKKSQQYHDQASDAEDSGDDDRAEDLQMKADDEWDKHTSAMHAIENIDDEIRDLKDKARNKNK